MGDADRSLAIRSNDGTVAAVISLRGGCIRQLRHGNTDVMPFDTELAHNEWFSSAVLAPWPNRLAHSAWQWNGQRLCFTSNEPRGHALHGLVFHRIFSVVSHTDDTLVLSTQVQGEPGYPFSIAVEIRYTATASGIASTLMATNTDVQPVPVALGIHPYFPWTEGCTIRIDAEAVCENDAVLIPTGTLLPTESVGVTTGADLPIEDLELDHCFTQLHPGPDGRTATTVRYPDGAQTVVWQDSALGYLQVFTTREAVWAENSAFAVGIEPQTSPADVLNNRIDLPLLEPGAALTVHWGIEHTAAGQ